MHKLMLLYVYLDLTLYQAKVLVSGHNTAKSCEHEIVFVLICTHAEQFHVHKSYKMGESTL